MFFRTQKERDKMMVDNKVYCQVCHKEISWRAFYASTNSFLRQALCRDCWAKARDQRTKKR